MRGYGWLFGRRSEAEFDAALAAELQKRAQLEQAWRDGVLKQVQEIVVDLNAKSASALEEQRAEVLRLEKEVEARDEADRAEAERLAAIPPAHTLACTCGCQHFTAGGQVVTPKTDGRCHPSGGLLSCIKCGARWAQCGEALVEPHANALPPAWAIQDIRDSVAAKVERPANPELLRRLQAVQRRSGSESLRRPSR